MKKEKLSELLANIKMLKDRLSQLYQDGLPLSKGSAHVNNAIKGNPNENLEHM
jgi:hypothetical protein